MTPAQVLIVGAGPTGLVLATWLARQGVTFRIIDTNDAPGLASRAMVVQARTLEFYNQLGLADDVVDGGIKVQQIHLREGEQEVATFKLGDMGAGLSPYPFALSYPQDDHERLLSEKLHAQGIEIEWNTKLLEFSDDTDHVRATLIKNDREETCRVDYLCGCDGAYSAVRQGLRLGFPGGTYDQVFFVADVLATGVAANQDLNICLGTDRLCLVFPIRSTGMYRLIGLLPPELWERQDIAFEQVRPFVEKLVGIRIEKVNWFSRYHVHHRVAEHFRVGRAFIAGDAGHIHSPAGGQGMNTGIGDAVNLAWKLAAVLQQKAAPDILDTYEAERILFARSLVETTDKAFNAMVGNNAGGQILRTLLVPHLMPFLLGFSGVRKAAFRFVSQTRINYHESALSVGTAGEVHSGNRLPWVEEADNFATLKSLDWQVQIYGEAGKELRDFAASRNLPVNEFPWHDEANAAGLHKNALYLVRPDGYLAFVAEAQDVAGLGEFLDRFGILTKAK